MGGNRKHMPYEHKGEELERPTWLVKCGEGGGESKLQHSSLFLYRKFKVLTKPESEGANRKSKLTKRSWMVVSSDLLWGIVGETFRKTEATVRVRTEDLTLLK